MRGPIKQFETILVLALAALSLVGCASAGRFKDQPVVWKVDDTRNIAEPEERPFDKYALGLDWFATRRLTRALELRDKEPAHNTNALDEVPNSSWFTNRIGVRRVSPKEAATGASAVGPPKLPITVTGGKTGGGNPGFFVKDARGITYLTKFDTQDNPEMQTATGVIVNRIFWTLGYFVPNDSVFSFSRDQLRLSPKAKMKDAMNRKRKMTPKDVEEVLATAPRFPDGRYRAFSSQFLKGVPKGGFPAEGVRDDDPNDVVPHEHRREIRGIRVFAAWVNHSDMKEDNSLDMYVEEGGRRFLRHYFLDFGEALDAHGAEKGRLEDGYEHFWDWERQGRAFVSFGLWKRPWEDLEQTKWPSIGAFSADHFDPRGWREAYPFWPFFETDAADAYWAAKIVMRFDRPILKAVVAEGKLSEPDAAAYLVDVLLKRRDKIGAAYLEAVTPLDHFTIQAGRLCAIDLGIRFGLVTHGTVEALDADGDAKRSYMADRQGRVCIPIPADDNRRYYRLRIRRGKHRKPPMQVHFRGGKRARILGIIRVEQ